MVRQFQDVPAEQTRLLRGARQVLTLRGPAGPRRGAALSDLGIIADGAVLIRGDKILQASLTAVWKISPSPGGRARSMRPAASHAWIHRQSRATIIGAAFESARRLEGRARSLLANMARHGTTTVATVANALLDGARELKTLRVLAGLDGSPLTVFTAYCAQLVPPEYAGNEVGYVDSLCSEALPAIARRKLVRFADVNSGAIELTLARKFLECARSSALA